MAPKTDTSLKNIQSYNAAMRNSLIDKIFWVDKVFDADLFIDFGCADGTLIHFLNTLFPEHSYIGYDNNQEMIKAAATKFGVKSKPEEVVTQIRAAKNVAFTTDWMYVAQVAHFLRKQSPQKKVCLILSSVIHEVYSYGAKNVDAFWKQIFDQDLLHPDYIAIRDMCVSRAVTRPSDPLVVARIRQMYNQDLLSQFEATWGSLEENWSLVHFLLKYRYLLMPDSKDRELKENYLPINKERLLSLIPAEYRPIFIEHTTNPFIRNRVRQDFDVDLQDSTHLKLVLMLQPTAATKK